jgi:tetratricopeptide (TPR) repeat protein
MKMHQYGRQLAASGKHEEALKVFLRCYDEGKDSVEFFGVRQFFLLSDLEALGWKYPPAREALVVRRDQAEKAMRENSRRTDLALDLGQLNEHLGQKSRSVEFFLSLPADSPARRTMAMTQGIYQQLMETKHYAEALQATDPEREFEAVKTRWLNPPQNSTDDKFLRQARQVDMQLDSERMAMTVEALAGAKEVERARKFAGEILKFDPNPNAQKILEQHATRAGDEELAGFIREAVVRKP